MFIVQIAKILKYFRIEYKKLSKKESILFLSHLQFKWH